MRDFACLLPYILCCIELGRVLGKEEDLDAVADFPQPLPNLFCLVPWHMVYDKMNFSPLEVSE